MTGNNGPTVQSGRLAPWKMSPGKMQGRKTQLPKQLRPSESFSSSSQSIQVLPDPEVRIDLDEIDYKKIHSACRLRRCDDRYQRVVIGRARK